MKKVLLIMMVILAIGICGCGSQLSSDAKVAAEDALAAVEKYSDYKTDASESLDLLIALHDSTDVLDEKIDWSKYDADTEFEDLDPDAQVAWTIDMMAYALSADDWTMFNEQRAILRDLLGE